MFSKIRNFISYFLPQTSDDLDEEEKKILNAITNLTESIKEKPIKEVQEEEILGDSDSAVFKVESFKCIDKEGKITFLCDEYGIIDDVHHFEPNQVDASLMIKKGDVVIYSSFKVRANEADRVYRVRALKNNLDIDKAANLPEDKEIKSAEPDKAANLTEDKEIKSPEPYEVLALTRCFTVQVTDRKEQKIFIEPFNTWWDLNNIKTSFIPLPGDWVQLKTITAVDQKSANLTGKILDIESLEPLLKKSGTGRITKWLETEKAGAIENKIYFNILICEDGYMPTLGDEVEYDAIESDQESYRWRAVKVAGIKNENNNENTKNISKSTDVDIFADKNGITISPAVAVVQVEFQKSKTVALEITNKGSSTQYLRFMRMDNTDSLLSLLYPKMKDNFRIFPNKKLIYEFECKGKFLGLTGRTVFFYFKNFVIARRFEIKITGNEDMNKFLECKFDNVVDTFNRNLPPKKITPEMVFFGPRLWKPPKFVSTDRKCIFNIPKKLWNIITEEKTSKLKALLDYAPYLNENLNIDKYAERFHLLLYLEEIQLRINIMNYEMKDVILERKDDFFCLKVPGLGEGRPSLIMGDKIECVQPWLDGGKNKFVGLILEINKNEIYCKFHDSFQKSYDGSLCDISFMPNVNPLSKYHEAVQRATKVLGAECLFPSIAKEKMPLVDLEIPEDPHLEEKTLSENACNSQNEENDTISHDNPPRKRLVWVNKILNERQKFSIVNILKGKGRPLPYIIFGPPGTGKTSTLVELIIQISRMFPESRILVSTPSNSAADLLSERLITYGNFTPGQFVRLVALYRVQEGLIPDSLIPYSAFYSNYGANELNLQTNIRRFNSYELSAKYRIVITTCTNVGALHYAGFPPGHFTHILVDESGQTSEPELLVSTTFQDIQKGQVILAGDPRQLGPVTFSPFAKHFGLHISLLERFTSACPYNRDINSFPKSSGYDPRYITKLQVNYRSVPEIISLSDQMFYNSDLITSVSQTEGREAEIIKLFNFKPEKRETPAAIIFHGIIGQNYRDSDSPSWYNPHEIWQVVFYIKKLYLLGLKNTDIGVISPYAKQIMKLRNLLVEMSLSLPKLGSVEEFQGQERYVTIVTTVRSSPKLVHVDVAHSLGFVACPQRLNVALTRARALLIIIGNPVLLSKDPYWLNVIKYCKNNNSYTGCSTELSSDDLESEKIADSSVQNDESEDSDFNEELATD